MYEIHPNMMGIKSFSDEKETFKERSVNKSDILWFNLTSIKNEQNYKTPLNNKQTKKEHDIFRKLIKNTQNNF